MPERELPGALARHVVETDLVDQLVDALAGDAVRLGECEQMVAGRATGVHRPRLEQRSHLVQRGRMVAVRPPVDGHLPGGRPVEPENQAHRGRLAGPVGAEKPRDDAGPNDERERVDGALVAVVLRQVLRLDHGFS